MTNNLIPSSHRRLGLLLAGLLALGIAAPASAQESLKSSRPVFAAFRDVVARASESTVRVLCDGKEAVLGTIVGEDGWIITKASELKENSVLSCKLKDGRSYPARLAGSEEKNDLAMLKIEARGLKAIEWHDSKSAEVGNWLASPGTGGDPVSIGVVSVATRKPHPRESIPARIRRAGFLGVQLEDASGAARIADITENSPASKAGLKKGDIVLRVEGAKITGRENMVDTIQRYLPGKTIVMEIKRGDEVKEIKATLGKRTAFDRADMQNNMGSKLSERRDSFPTILQSDQVIKPTDCGGPLVDLDGKAVGINIARAGRVESYAIPTESVLAMLSDFKAGKYAPKGPTIADLEKALDKARAELTRLELDLKSIEDARRNAETKKKQLSEQLADVQKRLTETQAALAKAKNDPTKK